MGKFKNTVERINTMMSAANVILETINEGRKSGVSTYNETLTANGAISIDVAPRITNNRHVTVSICDLAGRNTNDELQELVAFVIVTLRRAGVHVMVLGEEQRNNVLAFSVPR